MENVWVTHLSIGASTPMRITVDTRYGRYPGLPKHPTHQSLSVITVHSETHTHDGEQDPMRADMLRAMEAVLTSASDVLDGALLVGMTSSKGVRNLFFYCRDALRFQNAAEQVLDMYPDLDSDLGSQDDPDWSVYSFMLHPPEDDDRPAQNRRVLEVMNRNADSGALPREITHWAYFPSDAARDQFALQIVSEGFVGIEPTSEKCGLRFVRPDAPNAIDALTLRLESQAAAFGGSYDGWECAIETDRTLH